MTEAPQLGIELSITTADDKTHTGTLYTMDSEYNLVVLFRGNEHVRDFVFLNQSYIKSVKVLSAHRKHIDSDLPHLDVDHILNKADQSIRSRSAIPQNEDAPEEARQLFARLHKTYRIEWDGNKIVFPDLHVIMEPPYFSQANLHGPSEAVDRIWDLVNRIKSHLRPK